MTKIDLTDEFIKNLNEYIEKESGLSQFVLDTDGMSSHYVTLVRKRGGYTNQPFLHGDVFDLVGARIGKTGLILTCHTHNGDAVKTAGRGSHQYQCAEFKEVEARKKLAGFGEWFDQYLAGANVFDIAPKEPALSDEEMLELRGEKWGSW